MQISDNLEEPKELYKNNLLKPKMVLNVLLGIAVEEGIPGC